MEESLPCWHGARANSHICPPFLGACPRTMSSSQIIGGMEKGLPLFLPYVPEHKVLTSPQSLPVCQDGSRELAQLGVFLIGFLNPAKRTVRLYSFNFSLPHC